jgi:hypothetical protein
MTLLLSAYWPGNEYFVYLELVLLETCVEIFCDIFWQTHIWSRVALNTCCSTEYLTQAILYSTEWLIQKCINRCRQMWWFMAEVWYNRLLLHRCSRLLLLGQTGGGPPCTYFVTYKFTYQDWESYHFSRYIIMLRWALLLTDWIIFMMFFWVWAPCGLNNVINFFSGCWDKVYTWEFFLGSVMSQYYLHKLKRYFSNCQKITVESNCWGISHFNIINVENAISSLGNILAVILFTVFQTIFILLSDFLICLLQYCHFASLITSARTLQYFCNYFFLDEGFCYPCCGYRDPFYVCMMF